MKLKLLSAFLILLCFSCSDQEVAQNDQWQIRWSTDGAIAEGQLYLSKDNQARIVINEPDGLLFFQPEEVDYTWHLNEQKLTLTRMENGIVLEYEIIERSKDYIKLSYAGDFIIEIYR